MTGSAIRSKSMAEISAFGAQVLSHLLEPPNNSDKFAGTHKLQ